MDIDGWYHVAVDDGGYENVFEIVPLLQWPNWHNVHNQVLASYH